MPVLTFTALEAMLLGAGISLLTAVAVRLLFASRFVSRAECRIQREMLIRQKKTNDLMFAMFRAIIAHMDIPPGTSACLITLVPRRSFSSVPFYLAQTPSSFVSFTYNGANSTARGISLNVTNSASTVQAVTLSYLMRGFMDSSLPTDINGAPIQDRIIDFAVEKPRPILINVVSSTILEVVFTASIQVMNSAGAAFTVKANGAQVAVSNAQIYSNRYSFVRLTLASAINTSAQITVIGLAGAVTTTFYSVPSDIFEISR